MTTITIKAFQFETLPVVLHVQKMNDFLDRMMSSGVIGDGTVAPNIQQGTARHTELCHRASKVLHDTLSYTIEQARYCTH